MPTSASFAASGTRGFFHLTPPVWQGWRGMPMQMHLHRSGIGEDAEEAKNPEVKSDFKVYELE